MLNRIFGAQTHSYLHVLGLSGLAFGLPLNKVVMSISMMFLVLNLIVAAEFNEYWKRMKANRLFHLLFLFFLYHAVSLLWTSNISYGIHDLRVKLPLLIIPLVLTAKPIKSDMFLKVILSTFLVSVFITSVVNFGAYNQWFGAWEFDDIRGMSLFSSHVRYALLIVMSIAVIIHFFVQKSIPIYILIPLFVWFNFYTYYSQILSGAIALVGVYIICIFFWVWQKQKVAAVSGMVLVVLVIVFGISWLFKPITYNPDEFTYSKLGYKTAEGNDYFHHATIVSPETGKPIDIYICELELKREWENVSNIPYNGKDIKGQQISRTLIRYMASKDLKKDAVGFKQLSPKDIKAIERGHATCNHHGIQARISGLRFQLNNSSNPNGHSFLQRLEYWRTGIQIAKDNWILGVGAGDVQAAFNSQYDKNNSLLTEENRDRAHNMYLTILLSLGIIGLLLLVWSHMSFLIENFKQGQILAISFITIVLISYLVEDTLETQTGVTFFALFYGLFLNPNEKALKS